MVSFFIACNTTITDQGFTNKAEAKNVMVNGVKEGKWLTYNYKFPLGILLRDTDSYTLTVYKDGVPYGIARSYYMNGKLMDEGTFVNGKLNGVDRSYYKNGVLREEDPFIDNKYNGVVKTYFKNGLLQTETTYVNGVQNGIWRYYFDDGKLMDEANYKDGKPIGVKKRYYDSGKLWEEITYVNGMEGETKEFDENGNVIK